MQQTLCALEVSVCLQVQQYVLHLISGWNAVVQLLLVSSLLSIYVCLLFSESKHVENIQNEHLRCEELWNWGQRQTNHRILWSSDCAGWTQWSRENGTRAWLYCEEWPGSARKELPAGSSFYMNFRTIFFLHLQTIIECLKYATSGELPPGSKGGAFVHDPKVRPVLLYHERLFFFFGSLSEWGLLTLTLFT